MIEQSLVDYIKDILRCMPPDWLELTTHRLDIYEEKLAKVQFLEEYDKLFEEKYVKQKAVALKYDKEKNSAPIVTAQGSGQTAKNIIKIAEENGIPIKKDEDLVNMLSQIELNQEIPVELYQAVSEIFSFIYGISNDTDEESIEENDQKNK